MNLNLIKYFRIFSQALRIQFIKIGEYKINFFFDTLVRIFGFLIFLASWESVLGGGRTLPGWDMKGLLLLFALQNIFLAMIFMFVYGAQSIRHSITSGTLDIYLSRPVLPWLVILVTNNFFSLGGLLIGFGALFISISIFNLKVSFLTFFIVMLFLIVSTLIALSFSLIINAIAFWLGKFNLATSLFWAMFEFDFYPVNIFPVFVQVIVAFTVPFIFANTIPALFILEQLTLQQAILYLLSSIGIFIFNMAIFFWLWNQGVKKYEAFGG